MSTMGSFQIGSFRVETVDNRSWTPDELSERAMEKIIQIGDSSHPLVREQAVAFRENIRKVLAYYIREAVKAERVEMAVKLTSAGHPELVKLVNKEQ